MLIVKLTPACLDTSSLLLALIVFWWLCRLCTAMKTLCDAEPCTCDFVGRINCACRAGGAQELEVSRDGVGQITRTASYLHIQDCQTVRIKRKSFEELQSLHQVTVVNVRNLTLEEHSFSWNDSAIYETYSGTGLEVRIEDTVVPELPTYAFRGRVESIEFVRATIGAVRAYAFSSLAGTRNVRFRDCDIGAIEGQAFKKFVVENVFAVLGGRVRQALPSRALLDVAVKNELRFSGVRFGRVHSAAVRVHGPRKFQIQACRFGRLDGEAFVVHTRGPVFVDDNAIEAAATGAFAGVAVERHVLELSGAQELVFENNTLGDCARAALLFDATAFAPKLDWIYMDARCDCAALRRWLTDVVVYARHRGGGAAQVAAPGDARLDEVISCRVGEQRQYARLKDYSLAYCGEGPAHSAQLLTAAFGMAALLLLALATAYWIWYKHRNGRWLNVPQSSPLHEGVAAPAAGDALLEQPSPCYEEPSTSRRQIVFVDDYERCDTSAGANGRHHFAPAAFAKETELRVIAERSPQLGHHVYANRVTERSSAYSAHEYSNPYAELNGREYKCRVPAQHRQQLLTSDL